MLAEQVLAATKLHDAQPQDRAARLEALRKVELLQAKLEDPKEAMFRQFTDVMLPKPESDYLWAQKAYLLSDVAVLSNRFIEGDARLEGT